MNLDLIYGIKQNFFRFFAYELTDLTNQTTACGNKCACSSKRTYWTYWNASTEHTMIKINRNSKTVLFLFRHTARWSVDSEIISLPPQMWEELRLPCWHPEICTTAVVIKIQLLNQTMKFSLLLPSHENWMNPESLLLSFCCLETSGPVHCGLMRLFWGRFLQNRNFWCAYT